MTVDCETAKSAEAPLPIQIPDCHGRSDVGQERPLNEDRFIVANLIREMSVRKTNLPQFNTNRPADPPRGVLMAVADGVGGRAGGSRASELTVETLADFLVNSLSHFLTSTDGDDRDLRDELSIAVDRCQRRVSQEQRANPQFARMGSTLTAAYVVWPNAFIVHVGDSRCYLFRNGKLTQLTRDHTVAQQFVDGGALSQEEARHSRFRHMLWNCIGADSENVAADIFSQQLRQGDRLLLCSDGLTDRLSEDQIASIVQSANSSEKTTEQLIEVANAAGGQDNITALVAGWPHEEFPRSDNIVRNRQPQHYSSTDLADTLPM